MSNPFASPPDTPRTPGFVPQVPGYNPSAGFVTQVRVVAILMMVLGSIEALIGLVVIVGMIVVTVNVPSNEFDGAEAAILGVVYGGFAAVFVILGFARIVAGYMNYQFRARLFGIITHFAGFVLMLTCYCAVTSVAMGVYGLIVYFQPVVAEAFAMRRRGSTSDEVLVHFRKLGTYAYAAGPAYMQPGESGMNYGQPQQPFAPSQPASGQSPGNLPEQPQPGPEAERSTVDPPTDSGSAPGNPQ